MTGRTIATAIVAICAAACGGAPKKTQPDAKMPMPNGAAMMPDSMTKAAPAPGDSTRAGSTADSAAKSNGDQRLRDSAFGPKFGVDPNGKVTPLKKKP